MSHLKSEGLHSLVVSGLGWSGLGWLGLLLRLYCWDTLPASLKLFTTVCYTLKRETLGSNLYDNSAITRTEKQKLTGDKMHMAASCWPD